MVVIKSFIEEDPCVSGIETNYGTYLITTIRKFYGTGPWTTRGLYYKNILTIVIVDRK